MQRMCFVLFIGAATAIVGCNKGPSLKTYPVTGTVTYNGKPLADATVTYLSKAEGQGVPATTGTTDSDGLFSLSTYLGPKDVLRGAPPGDYKVTVVKKTDPGPPGGETSKDLENVTDEQRQASMSKMWAQQRGGDPKSEKKPSEQKPESEIPLKYAKPETSGLSATVVTGENEPREFKLTDD